MTNRLLRCFRGGFPTIGIVSLGVVRNRLSVLVRGGVTGPSPRERRSIWSDEESGLTTTIGGAGAVLSCVGYARCGIPAAVEVEDETDRTGIFAPFVEGAWLLLLPAR